MFGWNKRVSEFAINSGLVEDYQEFQEQWVRLTFAERDEWSALATESGY